MTLINELDKIRSGGGKDSYIAEYMIVHYRSIPKMQLKEIQSNTFCSSSTLSRFFKRLGYRGFAEFKSEMINEESMGDYVRLHTYENVSEAADEMSRIVELALLSAKNNSSARMIEQCCEMLVNARVTGLLICEERLKDLGCKYRAHMRETGVEVLMIEEENLRYCNEVFTDQDCLLLVGDHTSIERYADILDILTESGLSVVVISDRSLKDNDIHDYHEIILPDCVVSDLPVKGYLKDSVISLYMDLIMVYTYSIIHRLHQMAV